MSIYEEKPYLSDEYTDYLMHYGTPRHSGRYPWGSGDDPYQHEEGGWYARYQEMKKSGMTDNECAAAFGMNTTQFREMRSLEKEKDLNAKRIRANQLRAHGNSYSQVAEIMGTSVSNVKNWTKPFDDDKKMKNNATVDMLEKEVLEKGMIDVGKGVETEIGVSRERMKTALSVLKEKGYSVEEIQVEQATNPGKYTTVQVLAKPGMTKADIWKNADDIQSINEYSPDNGGEFWTAEYPQSISSDRIYINYTEDGGSKKDGVIELRPGVDDLSLGKNSYAQVRIGVDDKMFMKGMAIYSDNIPDGYDVVFNTNKHKGTDISDVLKPYKEDDKTNPFGATIKPNGQYKYIDEDGNERLGAINLIKKEGDVEDYSKSLAAQFLSKQDIPLIKRQLNLKAAQTEADYEEIMSLDNAAVKKKLLKEFASQCDSDAVELKAAALPRQSSKFILPVGTLKDDEIYAPGYKDGETVCLIRYPHAGIFEIPELKVNNRNKEGQKFLGKTPIDAVGINTNVAEKLSGADFDGDTVIVIPTNSKVKIKSSDRLKDLVGFDPKEAYRGYSGMKVMTEQEKQLQMGMVSNLITDMTLRGAPPSELARAVKHSMVVIDAPKHKLDWKASEADNGIQALQKKWQKEGGGASTLISKAGGMKIVDEFKDYTYGKVDEKGNYQYKETGRTYKKVKRYSKDVIDKKTGATVHKKGDYILDDNGNKTYKIEKRKTKTTKMAYVSDAYDLSSGHPKENIYADYANRMKDLARKARLSYQAIKPQKVDATAAKLYSEQVASIDAKLKNAKLNAPRERMAQIKTKGDTYRRNQVVKEDKEHQKKYAARTLTAYRQKYGVSGKKRRIVLNDLEWQAIQNNAISTNKLMTILDNTDTEELRKRATPRSDKNVVSPAKQSLINSYKSSGYTTAEIAERLGISTSTVSKYIKE